MKMEGIDLFGLFELVGKGKYVLSSWKGKKYIRRYVKPKIRERKSSERNVKSLPMLFKRGINCASLKRRTITNWLRDMQSAV